MSEQVENKGVPLPKDVTSKVLLALNTIIYSSHGAAIVNTHEVGMAQEELAASLPPGYSKITVTEILANDGSFRVPEDSKGLVLLGYSDQIYQNPDQEIKVENFVRSTAITRGSSGNYPVLVLSDSLPNADIFRNHSLPWFNRPFDTTNSIWSIRVTGAEVERTKHKPKIEFVKNPKPRQVNTWQVVETTPIIL